MPQVQILRFGHETSITVNVKWYGVAKVGMSETTRLLKQGRISKYIEWNMAQDRVNSVASSRPSW